MLDEQHRIDAGVAGNNDRGWVYALAAEVVGGAVGGSEVKVGDPPGEDPVYFLREGFIRIAGAESCLDMADWNSSVESGQGTTKGSSGVALNEDDVGVLFGEYRFKAGDDTRRGLIEGLPRVHDVKVPLRRYVECVQNLVQHLAVLRCDADTGVEVI